LEVFKDTNRFLLYAIFKCSCLKKCALKLSIDLAIGERLSYIFHREKKNWAIFFFKFKIWNEVILLVFFGCKIGVILFYAFLKILLQKINTFKKKPKVHLIVLTELYNKNKNHLLLDSTNILKFIAKNVKKRKKKKCSIFFYT
jgi:hypothetical protein